MLSVEMIMLYDTFVTVCLIELQAEICWTSTAYTDCTGISGYYI